ncbi:unnamed protein product [Gadus morhua 'NCC']
MAGITQQRIPAFWTVLFILLNTVYSIRRCGPDICSDDQICCPPGQGNVTCCKPIVDPTYYNIAMITRKLSGILLLLLLFAMGYSIQRLICSKTRRRIHDTEHLAASQSPSGHPTPTVSREPLIVAPGSSSESDAAPPASLPTYEECICKRLPTYEESLLESSLVSHVETTHQVVRGRRPHRHEETTRVIVLIFIAPANTTSSL